MSPASRSRVPPPSLDPAHSTYGYTPADRSAPPAVSVITPYYNTGPLLYETAESLLRQSLQQWEWIVVNDGSTDAGLRALLPLRGADPRIRVIDQPNRGQAAARNAGVAASSAPLLFFLDSDDLLAPTALEKLAWTLASRPESAMAGGWSVSFGAVNATWPRGFGTRHAFPFDNTPIIASMVRRCAFDSLGGFDEGLMGERQGLEDFDFWTRAAAAGLWGHDVREYLVWIRRKTEQQYPRTPWAWRAEERVLRDFRRERRARYPELFRSGPPRATGEDGLFATHALVETGLPFENRLDRPHAQRRILLLLPSMQVGGADRFVLDLAAGLVARGDRVTACLTRDDLRPTWLGELLRLTPDVFDLRAFLRPADYPRFLSYLVASRQISHVLLSHALLGYQLLPFLRTHCAGVAYVDVLHAEQAQRHGGFPRVAIEHDELLDLHVTTTGHLRGWMVERGASPERIEVCTTNVDLARWSPDTEVRRRVRAELGVDDRTALILFAGRLSSEKRPRLAVEIMRRLRDAGTPFLGVLVGDGEDRRGLRLAIRSGRLGESVRMLGAVPAERIRELMRAADILLLPSEREGIAVTLFEAMACGAVPVAADVGGQRELVAPECGVLIPHGPAEAERYVAALRRLIERPEERARMARAGRARVERHFRLDQMVDRMEELLDRAGELAGSEPRPEVSAGVGLAMASLAIEHFQLEQRLRRLPPARLLQRLRWSSAWRWVERLGRLRAGLDRLDRRIYEARREGMRLVRRVARAVRP